MWTSVRGFIDHVGESDYMPTPQNNRRIFHELTWSRDKLFKTVSHNTVDETYKSPCTTTGGDVIGSPCILPIIFPDCSESFKSILLKAVKTPMSHLKPI